MTDPTPPPEAPAAAESSSQDLAQPAAIHSRYDADGSERPHFILSFPSDPELDRLVQAFEAGNFAYVRKEAPRLAVNSARPEVRDAATELRRRTEPDKAVVILLGIAVLFFSLIVLWVYLGQHHG